MFLTLNDESSFIMTWAIGYEILATLALLFIMKSAISFSVENSKKEKRPFIRP